MKIHKTYTSEIVVAGGGVAGIAAAVEAARSGKKVLLIEKSTQLGGLATIGRINFFVPMCNGRGTQIVKGMADEFLRLSYKYGYSVIPEDWQNGEPGQGNSRQRLMCRYSAPIFSLALMELLHDLRVDVLFDTVITDAAAENGRVKSLTLFNKSGYSLCEGDMFIDATGDADLLHYLGVPTETVGNYHTYYTSLITLESCKAAVEANDIAKMHRRVAGGFANLHGERQPEGKRLWDGTNGDDVSAYLVENQLEMLDKIRDDDRSSRDIPMLPVMPQFRATRRLIGNATLQATDVYRHFEDSVGAICDFERSDAVFEIPYGVMVRDGWENLMAVGRCASAEGYAWDVLRVIPPVILTGQAAGAAVCQALDAGRPVTEIDIPTLQRRLAAEDVMIHFDDSLIPEDRDKEELREFEMSDFVHV